MLDTNLFREDKGNNPERVRESQRRRFASVELVDEIIELDKLWRQRQFGLSNLQKDFNRINEEVARLKMAGDYATEMIRAWTRTSSRRKRRRSKCRKQRPRCIPSSRLSGISSMTPFLTAMTRRKMRWFDRGERNEWKRS